LADRCLGIDLRQILGDGLRPFYMHALHKPRKAGSAGGCYECRPHAFRKFQMRTNPPDERCYDYELSGDERPIPSRLSVAATETRHDAMCSIAAVRRVLLLTMGLVPQLGRSDEKHLSMSSAPIFYRGESEIDRPCETVDEFVEKAGSASSLRSG